MFTSGLGFDPVAWIAKMAAHCDNKLFVDDLLGLAFGPGQTLLLYLALLASTKRAGLKVEDHHCVSVRRPNRARAAQVLQCFPVILRPYNNDGFCMSEGPVEIYAQILVISNCCNVGDLQTIRRPCKCKTKHGLVPAALHSEWAASLARTPLTAAVTAGVRFLGGYLCSLTRPNCDEIPLSFTSEALAACAVGTYKRCLTLTEGRVSELRTAKWP